MVSSTAPLRGPRGYLEVEGERLYYETYGAGTPLVLCHGLGGNHAIWYQQVAHFARRYRVITWDQRGFGRSSNDAGQTGPAAAVRDLAALLDALDLQQPHLVGQSMGGWAALGHALEHVGRVRSLVLADSIGGIYTPQVRASYEAFRPRRCDRIGSHDAVAAGLSETDLAKAFLYEQIGDTPPPLQARMRELLRETEQDRNAIARLAVPTLLVVGSEDPIFPPHVIREAAGVLPDARVAEIDGAGHSPYFERPDAFNDVVECFLEEIGG